VSVPAVQFRTGLKVRALVIVGHRAGVESLQQQHGRGQPQVGLGQLGLAAAEDYDAQLLQLIDEGLCVRGSSANLGCGRVLVLVDRADALRDDVPEDRLGSLKAGALKLDAHVAGRGVWVIARHERTRDGTWAGTLEEQEHGGADAAVVRIDVGDLKAARADDVDHFIRGRTCQSASRISRMSATWSTMFQVIPAWRARRGQRAGRRRIGDLGELS
jgi:hypothetical protein